MAVYSNFDRTRHTPRFATILASQAEAAGVLNISSRISCGYRFKYVDVEDGYDR